MFQRRTTARQLKPFTAVARLRNFNVAAAQCQLPCRPFRSRLANLPAALAFRPSNRMEGNALTLTAEELPPPPCWVCHRRA